MSHQPIVCGTKVFCYFLSSRNFEVNFFSHLLPFYNYVTIFRYL